MLAAPCEYNPLEYSLTLDEDIILEPCQLRTVFHTSKLLLGVLCNILHVLIFILDTDGYTIGRSNDWVMPTREANAEAMGSGFVLCVELLEAPYKLLCCIFSGFIEGVNENFDRVLL
jgi:hypothetical protein